jgi:hypothetical protein
MDPDDDLIKPKPFRRKRDWVDWFEIVTRVLLTMAGLAVAIFAFLFQRVDQQRAADSRRRDMITQIRERHSRFGGPQSQYGENAIPALVPFVLRGTLAEKQRAFAALSIMSPGLAADLSAAVLEDETAGAPEKTLARRVNKDASEQELEAGFYRSLKLARDFFGSDSWAEACEEFSGAAETLPEVFVRRDRPDDPKPPVDITEVTAGVLSCKAQEDLKGANKLHDAFKKIQTP